MTRSLPTHTEHEIQDVLSDTCCPSPIVSMCLKPMDKRHHVHTLPTIIKQTFFIAMTESSDAVPH